MLRGTDARAAFEGDLDRVSPRRLRHYLESHELLSISAWLRLADDVNAGVFPGAGEVYQEDAHTFLAHAAGDVVYLDPPYPGTTAYEHEYGVLDELLEGERRPVSAFSRSPDVLPSLLDACEHIAVWLISMNNAVLSRGELEALVRPHRRYVRSVAVPYRHLGSIASKEKNHDNQEFIVLATNQP
jgi:site-specific DNA-adenine methylase